MPSPSPLPRPGNQAGGIRPPGGSSPTREPLALRAAGRGVPSLALARLLAGCLLFAALPLRGATIAGFAPDRGGPGTEVAISGTGLQTTLFVYFGGTDATGEIVSRSANLVWARVPPNAHTGPVSVFTSGSGSASSLQVFVAAPRIESFSPLSGTPDTLVTISGANFGTGQSGSRGNVTSVLFNNQPARFEITGINQLLTLVPTNATSGPITVANEAGTYSTLIPFQAAALLTGFTPAKGGPGDAVEIRGHNLAATVRVEFGLETARFTILSTTNLLAFVPTNAINGRLQITTPAGTTATPTQFVVTPRLMDFTPAAGAAGTNVLLVGGGFHGLTEVRFGDTRVQAGTLESSTRIRAVVPSGAATGPLTVVTTNGSYTTSNLFHLPARLTSFNPNSAARGAVVTLDGANLAGTTNVLFNGVPAGFDLISPTRLAATVPPLATTGRIAVRTPAGEALSSGTFNVRPVLDGFTPASGPVGTPLTLQGSGLTNLAWVRIGDLEAASVTVIDSTRVRAIVPLGAYSGPVRARTQTGIEVAAPGTFFVDGARPVLTSFTPDRGPVGTPVLLRGEGLRTASRVQFNGADAAFTVQSATQIEATVPGPATSGTIAVTTLDGIAVSSTAFVVVTTPVVLAYERTADTLLLRWPATATGFTLEASPALGPAASWQPVPTPPVDEGATFRVTVPLPQTGNRHFRLRR